MYWVRLVWSCRTSYSVWVLWPWGGSKKEGTSRRSSIADTSLSTKKTVRLALGVCSYGLSLADHAGPERGRAGNEMPEESVPGNWWLRQGQLWEHLVASPSGPRQGLAPWSRVTCLGLDCELASFPSLLPIGRSLCTDRHCHHPFTSPGALAICPKET